jgi:hypothetical protein
MVDKARLEWPNNKAAKIFAAPEISFSLICAQNYG